MKASAVEEAWSVPRRPARERCAQDESAAAEARKFTSKQMPDGTPGSIGFCS